MSQRIAARPETFELLESEENHNTMKRTRQNVEMSPSAIAFPVPDQRQMTSCSGTIDTAGLFIFTLIMYLPFTYRPKQTKVMIRRKQHIIYLRKNLN